MNAVIQAVGLTKDGYMEVPKRPGETAWYKYGPKPGNTGSAVIAGHINWLYGATGVFAKLKALSPGDTITIQDDTGKNTAFIVRTVREYNQNENAETIFRSYDGKAHLNLVTCSGVWDTKTKMYTKRFVVFADAL